MFLGRLRTREPLLLAQQQKLDEITQRLEKVANNVQYQVNGLDSVANRLEKLKEALDDN